MPVLAEDAPLPARWPRRAIPSTASQQLLKVSVPFRDLFSGAVGDKLKNGLLHTVVVRLTLHDESDGRLVTGSVRTCRVRYDLWDEVYRVQLEAPGEARNLAFLAVEGVARQCAELREFAIPLRAPLLTGRTYFVSVRADVNPADPEMIEHLRRWVLGAAPSRSASDGLFASVVGLFVRDFAKSDRTITFRGQAFAP